MEITKALVADYANVEQSGKLNVLGIFSVIRSANFPFIHPQMQLIFMWEAGRVESGTAKQIEVHLTDADGKKLVGISGQFKVPEGKSGKRISGNHIVILNNIKFEKAGEHVFNILINGELKAQAEFEVVQINKTA
jgi:hypothetical protein